MRVEKKPHPLQTEGCHFPASPIVLPSCGSHTECAISKGPFSFFSCLASKHR